MIRGDWTGLPGMALLLFLSGSARANGGPVQTDWTAGARGGVAPFERRDVRLVSEELRLTLEADAHHYRVDAQYVISNPMARRVTFGVPLAAGVPWEEERELWDDQGKEVRKGRRPARRLEATAASVQIELAGRSQGCRLLEGAKGYRVARELQRLRARSYVLPSRRRAPRPVIPPLDVSESFEVELWCVTELALPAGGAVPLRLRYRGELEHWSDWDNPLGYDSFNLGGRLSDFAPRYLRYALFPAGYWAGPVERVRIELDEGRWANRSTAVEPPGARREGTRLRWDLERPDLRQLGAVIVRVDPGPQLRRQDMVRHNRALRAEVRLEASSPDQSAASLLDGDERTGWCADKSSWVELRLRGGVGRPSQRLREWRSPEDHCELHWLGLVLGERPRATRPAKIGLGRCGESTPGTTLELPSGPGLATVVLDGGHPGTWFNQEPLPPSTPGKEPLGPVLTVPEELARSLRKEWTFPGKELLRGARPWAKQPCVRLTVLEPEAADASQVCLQELVPVLLCD